MLYVLFGTDGDKTRDKLHVLLDQLHAKRPDAERFRLDSDHFNTEELETYISSQGLFENKYIVVLDHVFEDKNAKECVLSFVKDIAESDNVFILLEEKLDAETRKKIEKYAQKSEEHTLRENKKVFNLFSLTDAIGARNKKRAWVLYREAVHMVDDVGDIHNILFWQIKGMILATTSSQKESGLKPFPYKKAKEFSQNFSLDELKILSKRLVTILYESRRNKDLETELERLILSL